MDGFQITLDDGVTALCDAVRPRLLPRQGRGARARTHGVQSDRPWRDAARRGEQHSR
ncbi:hypothetical protein FHR81_000944 [Actinoalloteichus hoggarensis]|uniref:hypothetical protein n=1 Tax=Actinoalloteichus hoggarensis TaxID=1470176 RepID=UPI0012FDA529|nr:hypothetical protein [Actinoalloteichus hoggarensis]MBB5919914.1 hypothetical protein [Actinoalloteichus hoggarensis]